MKRLADPRDPLRIRYSQPHLLWSGILLFLLHLGSRRQLRHERATPVFARNLATLADDPLPGPDPVVADPDTLAYYACRIPSSETESLLTRCFSHLLRQRVLDPFRLRGFLPVAIDGSQVHTFAAEPWPGCPHRTLSDGRVQYFAYVLDAKLVTPCGMALPLATEWISNEGHADFDKQDCEAKALHRLIQKLKTTFPRTPFCLLLDSLSANQHVLRACRQARWKYLITFKQGSMPERFAEALRLRSLQPENTRTVRRPDGDATQTFRWIDALPVEEMNPSVLWCDEEHPGNEITPFCWLTNFSLNQNNVESTANQGGRLRWNIENEGFNVQKNGGYAMGHVFSAHPNAFRVFYLFLLLAHLFNQLLLHSNLIVSLQRTFGSAKNFARRLAESLRNALLPPDPVLPGQIRFHPP
jgi:hypothetical protein